MKQILVTNDDGIYANGIRALVEVASQFGEVTVVAPDRPQSAMGHAITIGKPLRITKVDLFGDLVKGAYAISGTPVDCVSIGIDQLFEEPPCLCLSGVNHGSNSSINVIYSGTMSAAMQAALAGIESVGFSNVSFDHDADFSEVKVYAKKIVQLVLDKGLPPSKLLNVNFPNTEDGKYQGIKICRQADALWTQEYDARIDPQGRKYYWLTGQFIDRDKGEDTDLYALKNGYISVVPVMADLTAHADLPHFADWTLGA